MSRATRPYIIISLEHSMSKCGKDLVVSRIQNQTGDRVPVLPPLQTYFANRMAGIRSQDIISHPDRVARAQIKLAYECGFDGIDAATDTLAFIEACGSKVRIPSFGPSLTIKPVLHDLRDIVDLKVPDPSKDRRFQSSIQATKLIVKEVGNSLFTYSTLCGPLTLAGELRGLDHFISDLNTSSVYADDLLEFSIETFNEYADECANLDIDAIIIGDPICSGEYLSEEQFLRFAVPALQKSIKRIKKAGKYAMVHICGGSRDILRHLSTTDADIVWVDAELSDISEDLENKTILGNLPCDCLTTATPFDVFMRSMRCLESMSSRKFILGVGCIIPVAAKMANLRMMRSASNSHSLIEL